MHGVFIKALNIYMANAKKNIFVMNENSNQLSPLRSLQNWYYNTDEGNLCNNQGLLKLMIIYYILMTFTFDSRVRIMEKLEASHPLGI